MKIPDDIINLIKDKYIDITEYDYEQNHKTKIKLSDQIVIYNIGNQWKVIPLLLLLSYPIIYDEYIENDIPKIVTVALCPITLKSSVFMGKYKFQSYYESVMILEEIGTDKIIPITSGITINDKLIVNTNKRFEIKIMTLKNAIMIAPDMVFIQTNKKIQPIIDLKYYNNKKSIEYNKLDDLDLLFHPKTLTYVIQYKSYKTGEDKTSILIGNDASKDEVGGYDLKKSKLFEYLNKYKQKLLNREGYIYPCLWYIAKDEYDGAKVIYVK